LEVAKLNDFDDFTVLVGAEIKTPLGEITGLFLNEEISTNDPFCVIDAIKDQGGLSVLPHPFRSFLFSHLDTQEEMSVNLVKRVDAIEVFNSRTRRVYNEKARLLAIKMNKPMVAGSDAHFYPEIGNVRVSLPSFENMDGLKGNILAGKTKIEKSVYSTTTLYYQFKSFIYNRVRRMETVPL
jgi:predicted metal-dependent phosphoesterase TrpH